jgi:oligopeptide transport system substrate-binding protein
MFRVAHAAMRAGCGWEKFACASRRFLHAVVLLAFFAGCARQNQRADLVILNGVEPETLDPALITGQPEGRLAYALFEGLTSVDAAGTPQPGVAEKWEISADGKTYLFHLRHDARWSNGDAVTAIDFVDSWKRTLAPDTASEYAYQLHYLKNGRAFNEGTLTDFSKVGVRAVDSFTLEVELENPTPFFLDLCWFETLLPVHMRTVRREGDDWIKPGKLVGNGAYMLTSWRINDRIRLTKNPQYWNRENVKMETIDVLSAARPNTALNYYLTGLADVLLDKGLAPTALMGDLKKRDDFHAAAFLGTYFFRFNVMRPPLNDARVRRALSMVIDKETIVKKITKAGELPAANFVPPGTGGYQADAVLPRNPDEARRLLAAAGYPNGAGFPPIYYLYKGDSDLDRDIAVEMQGMFQRELGVTMLLQPQEWKVYLRSQSSMDYDVSRSSWVGDYNDPNTFMDLWVTNGGNNRTGWANQKYDELIAAAARELDQQKRFALFHAAEKLLVVDEAPICPLFFYVGIQFYDDARLGGIQANLLDEHPFKAMYWKRP